MAAISRIEGNGHHYLKVMVLAEFECCLVLSIAPVDDDAGRNTQPASHIDSKPKVVQAERR